MICPNVFSRYILKLICTVYRSSWREKKYSACKCRFYNCCTIDKNCIFCNKSVFAVYNCSVISLKFYFIFSNSGCLCDCFWKWKVTKGLHLWWSEGECRDRPVEETFLEKLSNLTNSIRSSESCRNWTNIV